VDRLGGRAVVAPRAGTMNFGLVLGE
jgi:hypothetical protein